MFTNHSLLVPWPKNWLKFKKKQFYFSFYTTCHHNVIKNTVQFLSTFKCIFILKLFQTDCQDQGEEEGEEAEGDEMLIESAGEIIPLLGKAMDPHQFAQHYTQFLPMFYNLTVSILLKKKNFLNIYSVKTLLFFELLHYYYALLCTNLGPLSRYCTIYPLIMYVQQKKQSSDAQRSFGVGMVAECMSVAGPCLQVYADQLLSFLESLCKDQNDEVRNNAIFALGELVYHGGECIYPYPFN